jgi:hypothetical protein
VPRHCFGPERGRPNLDLHTAADIINRMVCLRRLRGRGLQGLRMSLNMRSPYKWREGEIVDRVTGQRLFIEWTANRFQPRRQKKRTTRSDRKWNRANRPALTLAEKHAVRVADVLNRGGYVHTNSGCLLRSRMATGPRGCETTRTRSTNRQALLRRPAACF